MNVKTKIFLNLIVSFLASPVVFAQAKYFKTEKLEIIDSLEYAKALEHRKLSLQNLYPKDKKRVIINENLKEVSRTKDSVIYAYKWDMRIVNTEKGEFDVDKLLGQPFPVPELKTITNELIDAKSLLGKPTLMNFWFNTCIPCIEEMPALNRIKNKFGDSINFISVNFQLKEVVQEFLKRHEFNFKHIANAHSYIDQLNIKSFPMNIFIDKNGILQRVEYGIRNNDNRNGQQKGDEEDFIAELNKLLHEPWQGT